MWSQFSFAKADLCYGEILLWKIVSPVCTYTFNIEISMYEYMQNMSSLENHTFEKKI